MLPSSLFSSSLCIIVGTDSLLGDDRGGAGAAGRSDSPGDGGVDCNDVMTMFIMMMTKTTTIVVIVVEVEVVLVAAAVAAAAAAAAEATVAATAVVKAAGIDGREAGGR